MGLRFLRHGMLYMIETFLHRGLVQAIGDGQEFIAAGASHELIFRHGRPQALGEAPDIGVPCLMSHAVVDASEIVQIKAAYAGVRCCRFRILQHFFAFIFIGKSCRLVQINFFLQYAVHRCKTYGLHKFISNQKYQHCDVRCDVSFQHRQ